jgi:iron complex outermembrane recepter protein
MKTLFIIFMLLRISTYNILAQNEVTGKVLDKETKEPLVGVSIYSIDHTIGTTTDNTGVFTLISEKALDTIAVSLIGYTTQKIPLVAGKSLTIELSPDVLSMEEVIITADRETSLRSQSPIAISKLSPKLIDETKASFAFEIVSKAPGVIMQSYNNEQHGMAIRQPMGSSAYYLYMEDGVPIRPLGVFNHNAILEINQFAISSIEVVKGPVSSIYGPEAVGGAINFITQRPTVVPTAKVGVQFDNWGFRRVQFGTGATFKKFGFYIGGLSSKQTNSWMTSSDYDKTTVNARLEYSFTSNTRLIGTFVFGKYFSQTGGSVDSIAFFSREYVSASDFTYRKSDVIRSRLTLEHDWKSGVRSFITLFQRNNKLGQNPSYQIRWNPTPSATNDPTKARGEINSNNFESYGIVVQHSHPFKFLDSRVIAGAVYDYSPNDYWAYQINLNAQLRPDGKSVDKYTIAEERPDIRISDYDAIIRNGAGYLQYNIHPFKNLRVSIGGRYDRMSFTYTNNIDTSSGKKTYDRLTPKIGATYDLGKDKGVYVNYSQGFSPPSLTAVFRLKPNTDPVEFYTNLEPSQFENYEIGGWVSLWKNKIHVEATVYQMNGTNELLSIRQADNSTDFQSAGKTLHRGVEFGLKFKPTQEFFFRLGGTNALHRFEDFKVSEKAIDNVQKLDGFIMPSSPRWSWNTEFYFYPKWLKNFRTSIEWQHLSAWYENQINTVEYEGYDVLNLRIGYQWKGIELYSNILNVTDALYAYSANRGNNAADRTNYNPAAPRTFVFGIQYNFVSKSK